MKTRFLIHTGLLALMIWLLAGCRQFVEDYEVSPNAPLDATPALLLPSAQVYVFNVYNNNASRIVSIFMQQSAGLDRQYLAHNRYIILSSDVDPDWSNAYEGALMDLKLLIEKADAERRPIYGGIGRILRAMTLGILTDCFGDIPYTEALQGKGSPSPRYDSQESIYRTIQAELDRAIELLNTTPDASIQGQNPGKQDLIHGGDVNKWLITAWTLKARYANHLSKLDPAGSAQQALAAVDKALELGASPASDALARYGVDLSARNPWALFVIQRGDLGMGGFLIDTMQNSVDPRIFDYAFPNAADQIKGYFPGEGVPSIDSISTIGLGLGNDNSPLPMVSFVELKFIEAEASLRVGQPDRAAAAYNTAMEASINSFQVDPDEVATYLEAYSRSANDIELRDIIFQKYIALFTQIEIWTDWRRTGFPQLRYPFNLTERDFPRSFPTPQAEVQRNPNAPNNRGVSNRVWWDR
jgi:tetratricopeptide (TPR) repeat protein